MRRDSFPFIFSSLILFSFIFLLCCSNSSQKNVPPGPPPPDKNSPPLAGTVDKTDTLQVMAYNVLTFGDGCQGNVSVLDSFFRTIIQFVQPDLLSCEKMEVFPQMPGEFGNLADEITHNVLNADFPGRYAYATPSNMANAGAPCRPCFTTSKN